MKEIKGRVFVIGDCHQQELPKVWQFIKRFDLGKESNIIVCGDMGLFWDRSQNDARYWIKQYEDNCNGVHLYWIDGNHENFDIIDSWKAKDVYDNSEHIHYCSRGTILNINGKTALCMGGADSIDKLWRREGISWWPQERITDENIAGISGHYDYVFTHCCPFNVFNMNRGFLCTHGGDIRDFYHNSEIILQEMSENIDFDKWFFGHYHTDIQIDDKFTCVYNNFIELDCGETGSIDE